MRLFNRTSNRIGGRFIRLIVRFVLLLLLLIAAGFLLIEINLQTMSSGLSRLDQALNNLYKLQTALVDQETGQRGYVLTGEEDFLAPFHAGLEVYTSLEAELVRQLEAYPALAASVKDLIRIGHEWHLTYGLPQVEAKAAGEVVTDRDLRDGKALLDDFRHKLPEIARHIATLQSEKTQRSFQTIHYILILLAIVFCVAGVVVIALSLRWFRTFVEPIQGLARAVAAYARQDFSHTVPDSSQVDGELKQLICNIADMRVQLKTHFENVHRLAMRDGLTGILNRRAFDELFQQAALEADRLNQPLQLMLLDIDRFKPFNDTHGHLEGDRALQAVARTLEALVREPAFCARYGGEEFALVLPNTSEENALGCAKAVLSAIRGIADLPEPITASIGLAGWQTDDTIAALIGRADEQLYMAKRNGRNRVESASDAAH